MYKHSHSRTAQSKGSLIILLKNLMTYSICPPECLCSIRPPLLLKEKWGQIGSGNPKYIYLVSHRSFKLHSRITQWPKRIKIFIILIKNLKCSAIDIYFVQESESIGDNLPFVFVHHSALETCGDMDSCIRAVQAIQVQYSVL